MAYAISFMMLAQLSGIALGLAISGAVFVNDAIANLTAVLPNVSREQLQMAISGTSGDYLSSLSEELRSAATNAIVEALRKVFIPVYVAAAFSLVLSVLFTVCFFPSGEAPCQNTTNTMTNRNARCLVISWPLRLNPHTIREVA